jgi:hypothetical protein
LWANLEVVAVVRERLFAPLAPFDSWCFHFRDLFEQQPFQVFNQIVFPPFLRAGAKFAVANQAIM